MCRWVIVVSFCGLSASAAERIRIGVVPIQDHGGRSLYNAPIDKRLIGALKGRAVEAVPLRWQPAADLEHQAREAGCQYILYTDIVDIRRAAGPNVAAALRDVGAIVEPRKQRKREIYEADVELRMFQVDQAQPVLATSVTARTDKKRATTPPPKAQEEDPLLMATPMEETARQRKYKSVAVANAVQNVAKLVREKLAEQ